MTPMTSCDDPQRQTKDYAIVGAGCAGLYSAWRLLNSSPADPPTIDIFERANRIGGRLLSIDPLKEGRKAELGGMRFTDKQILINALVRAFGMKADPFNFTTRLMYLRGHRLRHDDSAWLTKAGYALSCGQPSMSEAALAIARHGISNALMLLRPKTEDQRSYLNRLRNDLRKDTLTVEEWRDLQQNVPVAPVDRNLFELGFWNLLHRCLNTSEFLFLHDCLGYESLLANSNAAQAIPTFLADFDVPGYFTLADGMDSLPRKLEEECNKYPGSFCLHQGTTVKRITPEQEQKRFRIEVDSNPDRGRLNSEVPAETHYARQVILALPKQAMKDITFEKFPQGLNSFHSALEEVTSHPAFKLFLCFDTPWWYRDLGWLDARATTDLPIRQVFYMGDSDRGRPNDPKRLPRSSERGLLMASYSDEHYVDFWDPLVRDGRHTPKKDYAASSRIMDKAQLMLRSMHEGFIVPDAEEGYVQEWKEAWHWWNVHTKPWEAAQRMVKPFADLSLFTCGEAYSLEQGWIEGALKSTERVLRALGVAKPTFGDLGMGAYFPSSTFQSYIES
jgi:lysine 2-monooxygenase